MASAGAGLRKISPMEPEAVRRPISRMGIIGTVHAQKRRSKPWATSTCCRAWRGNPEKGVFELRTRSSMLFMPALILLWCDAMTPYGRYPRLTVEAVAADCVDVRDLHKAGVLNGSWVTFPWAGIRWPGIRKMRAASCSSEPCRCSFSRWC
jgi:hypothetical protein